MFLSKDSWYLDSDQKNCFIFIVSIGHILWCWVHTVLGPFKMSSRRSGSTLSSWYINDVVRNFSCSSWYINDVVRNFSWWDSWYLDEFANQEKTRPFMMCGKLSRSRMNASTNLKTLRHTVTHFNTDLSWCGSGDRMNDSTNYDTLQHTATHCNIDLSWCVASRVEKYLVLISKWSSL